MDFLLIGNFLGCPVFFAQTLSTVGPVFPCICKQYMEDKIEDNSKIDVITHYINGREIRINSRDTLE